MGLVKGPLTVKQHGGVTLAKRKPIDDFEWPVDEDQLAQLRTMVAEARSLEAYKAELEEKLSEVNKALTGNNKDGGLYFKRLPDLMTEIGISSVSLEAEGNMPAVEAKVGPYYQANIAAGWPEEKRRAGFDWLDGNGFGDLIKTEVTVAFRREDRDNALKFAALANDYGTAAVKEAVHPSTLTSWLREQVEEHNTIPPLEVIGGIVTRSVKLKAKP
jgi:hypothetical protein